MESSASTKWHTQRLSICLRFVAMFASLIAVITFGYSQGRHDNDEVMVSDLGHHVVTPATGTTEYAFIWSLVIATIELSTPVPIHPGIYIAFDFIAFGAVTAAVIVYLLIQAPYYSGDGYSCGRDYPDCDGKQLANIEHFATAMALLAVVIHFGFFVWACRATDKLRKSRRVSKKQGLSNGEA
ncbi:hypothetical protein BDW59DRAFT_155311 [Aspergillus cavernicola]|uniref:MARVEL domain-containing protein n=1 Tax=Aspergillus cavernicola TaxID=176166 RepID=A0ABR4HA40_9EURO